MSVPLRASVRSGSRWSAYWESAPHPRLAAVVACTWTGRPGWARNLRVLPDGCLDLVWNGQELTVVVPGPAPLRVPVASAGTAAGLRLRCGVGGSLLGTSMADLPHGPTRLADIWPEAGQAEAELAAGQRTGVLERLVRSRLAAGHEPDPVIVAAAHELGSAQRATSVACGLSDRSLRRRFRHELGHGPKQLHRVLRFQRLMRLLPALAARRTTLAVAAADLGFADQSHLGRECRTLSGSSPADLVAAFGRNVPDPVPGPRSR